MKPLSLFFLSLCLIEIYGQRIRTNTNQDVSTQEPKTLRGRGRTRFSESEELPASSERPSSNRRASTRTRIHSNNPKAAADRRARPITEATREYAVEEVNNDSPIDSFIRQSKPRVLTESRFEIPTVSRRQQTYQSVRTSPAPPTIDEVEVGGFGSTARAILQARGESLPIKTTTPVIDEAYLLTNFGSTIRSLVGVRNEVPIQRATPLRSEVPILDPEDIPLRRSSLRGDPLPSLRGSDISGERQISSRGKTRGNALATKQTRDNPRTSQRKVTEPARANARIDSQRKTIEDVPAEEIARLEPKTEAPESVEGIFEESDIVTEAQLFDAPNESFILEEEEVRKASSAEVVTPESAEASSQTVINNRRSGVRGRTDAVLDTQPTPAPRLRASRTRAPPSTVEIYTPPSARNRGARKRYDDPVVAESRRRGPSIFTAEQYQEVTSRSRPGRRIDSRIESVPERINVDLTPVATGRARNVGRRATTAGTTTERSSTKDRNSSRGRSRVRVVPEESNSAPVSRTTTIRRPSSTDDTFYGDRTGNRADITQATGRREKIGQLDSTDPRTLISRGPSVETPSNKRGRVNRTDAITSRSRGSTADSRRQAATRIESVAPKNIVYSRRQTDEAVSYGEKSSRTRTQAHASTTTEEPITVINRSKSRFSEVPPNIDESKLEVLPLFERETKTVPLSRSRGHRSRSSVNINRKQNLSYDHMQGSATENDVKFVEKPTTNAFTKVTVTRTESVEANTSRTRLSTRTASTTASTSTAETTRRPSSSSSSSTTTTRRPETSLTTKKWVTRSPPLIMESVVAEVNEVTSKSTFTRRKKVPKAKATEILARGSKKADVKLSDIGKKSASEEITEEDNYPEPFKALIQAKKKQVETRPFQSSPKGAAATSSITSTEKVFVTSAASPRGSSLPARVVTTESPNKRSQLVNEIVNDNENELDPKSTVTSTTPNTPTRAARVRQLPKFSEKPKYTQKPREKYTKPATEKPRYSAEKPSTKTTTTPKKTYSTKLYATRDPVEHHAKRKALRSTALPPSTTPMNLVNREAKFSAKFIRKEKNIDSNASKNQQVKSLYSSKKAGQEEEKSERNFSLTQTAKPSLPIKKLNASRYSSRYRSDPSQRSTVLRSSTSAPFYIPTIPTPAYVPTVPTMAPSVTPVGGIVAKRDKDLGLEVISFDDPVITIPSADLVNGEFLTTDKNIRLSPMVKDGTTEKPVSIIERIINSITAISTTEAPNITTTTIAPTSTSIKSSENSAILKLAPKKTTTKDKTIPDYQTNIIETITSEKPTTIIEKIRSSLSAIQSNEVGTSELNTVSSSPTTPLSTVTKYSAKFRGSSVGTTALPAPSPLSTSINPLSVFDDIDENQVLEKRTIGKLLNILNGLVSTNSPENLVVVTPKNTLKSGASPIGFTATTFSSQEPLEAISLNAIELRAGFIDSENSVSSSTIVNTESTSSGSTVNTESSTFSSIVNTETSTMETETVPTSNTESSTQKDTDITPESTETTISFNTETSLPEKNNEISTPPSTLTTTQSFTTSTLLTSTPSLTTNSKSPEINPLSIDFSTSTDISQESTTTVTTDSTTLSDTITTTPQTQPTSTVGGLSSSILYTFPSTIPTIPNIEVSPGSVSIFSANDFSNLITPDSNLFNTVTIASRIGFDNNVLTSTTDGATSTTVDSSTGTNGPTPSGTTESTDMTTIVPSATTTETESTTVSTSDMTTTMLSTTGSEEPTTMLTTIISSNKSNSSANFPLVSNRSGRILTSDIGEPVENSIEISSSSTTTSTTPDYFIFAILNNNTILRKRPPTVPNKDTPFIIVGLYPNNTVVRKYPNGTLIPMDPIIKVRGFDTRPNPPPLVEITSNQVTDTTNGMTTLDNNSVTVFTPCIVVGERCRGSSKRRKVRKQTRSSGYF